MRKIISILCLISVMFCACKKSKTDFNPVITDGIYKGTFQRQVSGSGQISNVTISFNSGNWSGQSQFVKYPALCNGTYQSNLTNEISFKNLCPWTAEFDWTLILSDTFKIKVIGNEIEISKKYNDSFQDIYKLTKQ